MKINLKVRMRNPVFWFTFIPAVLTCVYSVLGCFGIVPAISQDTIMQTVTPFITVLTTVGVLVDPTTKGVNDSENALTYTQPK